MWYRRAQLLQAGFTIVELTVVIVLVAILTTGIFVFSNTSFNQYLGLHKDSTQFNDLARQSQRLANVLRGLTDITQASADDITLYAYFVPQDTFVSQIHYYKNNGNTQLLADVTPMSANPPSGTPITAQMKTYTVLNPFYQVAEISTFVYLDAAGAAMPSPVADLHTIKGIQVNLAVPSTSPTPSGNASVSLSVSLRNRKTNL